jgi:hypothetical protein
LSSGTIETRTAKDPVEDREEVVEEQKEQR